MSEVFFFFFVFFFLFSLFSVGVKSCRRLGDEIRPLEGFCHPGKQTGNYKGF